MMIEFPVTATKTYNEAITEDPTIESGLSAAGYGDPTIEAIRAWYGDRIVCDDLSFKSYFLRLAAPLASKYNAQVRLETVDMNLDPFVENYSEHYIEHGGQDQRTPAGVTVTHTPAETTKTITPTEYTVTEKPAETTRTKTPVGYTDTYNAGVISTKSGSIERGEEIDYTDTAHTDNDTKGLTKANPMSSTTVTTGSGDAATSEITGLGWAYSSGQEQQTAKGYSQTVHDGDNSSTETYNNVREAMSGSDTNTRAYSGTEKDTLDVDTAGEKKYEVDSNGQEKVEVDSAETTETEYDGNEIKAYGRTIKERYTGRAGLTPQKALAEAITYLRTISPAFFDLMAKLEPAFLGVYDV